MTLPVSNGLSTRLALTYVATSVFEATKSCPVDTEMRYAQRVLGRVDRSGIYVGRAASAETRAMSIRARKPSVLREFLDGGAAGGLLLMASAVLALFVANSIGE